MTPAEFFRALYRHFDDGYLTLFSIDDHQVRYTDWFRVDQIDEMVRKALSTPERNVWFGVASRREPLGGEKRGGSSDCLAIPALWADIDIAGPNHKNSEGLPKNIDEAMALLASFPLQPSIVIHTGGGLHPYWVLAEPCPMAEAIPLLERWATTWDKITEKAGQRADNVYDAARVLRVPGTYNIKTPPPQPIHVIEANGLLYGVDDIIENTDDPPERAHRSAERGPVIGLRPGDEYNQRHSGGDVLSHAGWKLGRTDRSGDEHWLHPWNPTSDASATVYTDGHTAIWSDTAVAKTALEKRHSYDPYGLYAALFHDGDHSAASKQLASEGYGKPNVEIIYDDNGIARRGKRHVKTNNRHLNDLTDDVVNELRDLNDPPSLFSHGEIITQFDRGQLDPIDRVRLTHVVETSMSPVKYTKDKASGEWVATPARIDTQTLDLALYRLQKVLPAIEGVVHAPFFRADGTVCADIGYDPASKLYLSSTMPITVPAEPTCDDVRRSVAVVDELICDFPLETSADRAYVFALLLTMLTRHLVPLVPLFAFDGNGPGVGKNLLSECCVYVATGEWVQTDPLPLDAEEQRKQITALLATGRPIALFDEAHTVSGTSLARLITSTTWGDRLLGYSKQVSYPNRLTVVALGNNIEVQGDMPRRTVLIRLASELTRPELRQNFRHGDLRAWVTNHRAAVLEALLVMLRAWSAAGSTPSPKRLGSFDAWAQLVGGVLDHAGIDGFLDNADDMRQRAATDDTDMADHLAELHEHFGSFGFTTGEVAALLTTGKVETWPPKVGDSDRHLALRVGKAYRRATGRWYGTLQIVLDGTAHGGGRRWILIERVAGESENSLSPLSPLSPEIAKAQVDGDSGDSGESGHSLLQISSLFKKERDVATSKTGKAPSPLSPLSPESDHVPPRRRSTLADVGLTPPPPDHDKETT